MRRIFILTLIVAALFAACEPYEPKPIADFEVEFSNVIPGEVVEFTNYSDHANSYEWDFGDGVTSQEVHPIHIYSEEGEYNVTLASFNGDKVDYAYLTIIVQETTLLVKVVDYDTDDLIPRANVRLYLTYGEWESISKNYLIEAATDIYGEVYFKELDTRTYYIDAFNSLYSNSSLGLSDKDYIQTLPLEYAMINEFIAYVEYSSTGKAMRVREIKPVLKSAETGYMSRTERKLQGEHNTNEVQARPTKVRSHR